MLVDINTEIIRTGVGVIITSGASTSRAFIAEQYFDNTCSYFI